MKKLSKIFLITAALCLCLTFGAFADNADMAQAYLDVMDDASDRFDNFVSYTAKNSELIDMDNDGVSELCLIGEVVYYNSNTSGNYTSPSYEIFSYNNGVAECVYSEPLDTGYSAMRNISLISNDYGTQILAQVTGYAGTMAQENYFVYDVTGEQVAYIYAQYIGTYSEEAGKVVYNSASFYATGEDGRDALIGKASRENSDDEYTITSDDLASIESVAEPYGLYYSNGKLYAKNIVTTDDYTGSCVSELEAMLASEEEVVSEKDMVTDWAKAEVEAAREAGLVTERTEYYMTAYISRLAFAELIVNFVETVTGEEIEPAPEDTFLDTPHIAALKAYNAGIVNGMSEGIFGPAYVTNRQDIATMISRALDYIYAETGIDLAPESGDLSAFSDASDVSSYAIDAVASLAANGIMNGTSDTTLSPKSETSIEMAVILVYRLFTQI